MHGHVLSEESMKARTSAAGTEEQLSETKYKDFTNIPEQVVQLHKKLIDSTAWKFKEDGIRSFLNRTIFNRLSLEDQERLHNNPQSPFHGDMHEVYGAKQTVRTRPTTYRRQEVTVDVNVAVHRMRLNFLAGTLSRKNEDIDVQSQNYLLLLSLADEDPDVDPFFYFGELMKMLMETWLYFSPGGFTLSEDEKREVNDRLLVWLRSLNGQDTILSQHAATSSSISSSSISGDSNLSKLLQAERAKEMRELPSRLCVKGLAKGITQTQLGDIFDHNLDQVTYVRMIENPSSKNGTVEALVGFRTEAQAKKALEYFNDTFIHSSRITVEHAREIHLTSVTNGGFGNKSDINSINSMYNKGFDKQIAHLGVRFSSFCTWFIHTVNDIIRVKVNIRPLFAPHDAAAAEHHHHHQDGDMLLQGPNHHNGAADGDSSSSSGYSGFEIGNGNGGGGSDGASTDGTDYSSGLSGFEVDDFMDQFK